MPKSVFRGLICLLFISLAFSSLHGQGTGPVQGLHPAGKGVYALTHIHLVQAPGKVVHDATLVIREGKVESAGAGAPIPKDALVLDMTGRWVYPGFIDPWSEIGVKIPEIKPEGNPNAPIYEAYRKSPGSWNMALRPELRVEDHLQPSAADVEKMRGLGFTTLHILPNDGILRGSSLLMQTGDGPLQKNILPGWEAQALSFDKGSSQQSYPSSLMGSIALLRQTFLDAQWYANAIGKGAEFNRALDALAQHLQRKGPLYFKTGNYLNTLRALKLAQDAGLTLTCLTEGDEYQRPDLFKSLSGRLIQPLNFPAPPAVKDPAEAEAVPLSQLRRWEQAPTNPAVMHEHGIAFAFTLHGLKDPSTAWKQVRKAIAHGLPKEQALAALTTVPAQMLGQEKTLGRLEPGFRADFLITGDDLFQDRDPAILQVWVAGKPFVHRMAPAADLRGRYSLDLPGPQMAMLIRGTSFAPEAAIISGKDTLKAEFSLVQDRVLMSWQAKGSPKGTYALNGNLLGTAFRGNGTSPEGKPITWSATRQDSWHTPDTLKPIKPVRRDSLSPVTFPNMAYGFRQMPTQGAFLIRNATVWTNGSKGILQNTDVLVRNGKIAKVGKNLSDRDATVVDGTSLHLTPGIVDEHSHIAISEGVNEGSHAVTAEVSIADVIDPDDINIYRQLSGGVVASQLLHGSANPIGGQSAVIKLRWGMTAEEMKLAAAPGRIKFALGENVKQSNWGDLNNIRYPQTRMGVEQIMADAFRSALDYREQWKRWNSGGDKTGMVPPRKDLQMEVLLEIIDSKRLISCHSYQQGEIVMLMRLAERFGFRVNTFTHVLEGYKIAREIQQHGATASTFADWWAYKYEVVDAVPHNAAIMTQKGVNVCINSDDVEMARRLNQEAAKSMLYAGMKEEDALKMVTLNPARAFKVDALMGRVEEGMDADIVLWSANPLSVYAQAQKTWVDGRLLFDRSQQPALQAEIAAERARLIQKVLASGESPAGSEPPKGPRQHYECETLESDYNRGEW